jgi:DNA polymerase-4
VLGRIVLHADMDAFYASIEQRDRPELRGRPVIVGATSRRGVVAAASYEARKFGVRSAMPGFRARELCPDGVFLASNMQKYAQVSAQVQRVFEEFTDAIEPLALDEAFLDITGSVGLFGGPVELARRLKARVREETRLVISCGVAASKQVAKIACSLGKPDGLLWVPAEKTRELLDPLPIRWLFGIGPVAEKELVGAGYRTLADLANADLRALGRVAGVQRAAALVKLARGEDERPVQAQRAAKSYGEENTFEQDVSAREIVTEALTSHAQAVARRLRHDGLEGRTVTLRCKLARRRGVRHSRTQAGDEEPSYPLLTRSKTLPQPTDDGSVVRRVAIELWDAAAIAEPVRLLGVAVTQLAPRDDTQLDLFAGEGYARSRRLGPALDAIRERFGETLIRVGAAAPPKLTPTTRKKRGE